MIPLERAFQQIYSTSNLFLQYTCFSSSCQAMQKYFHNKTNWYKKIDPPASPGMSSKTNSAKFQNETASHLNGCIQQKTELMLSLSASLYPHTRFLYLHSAAFL